MGCNRWRVMFLVTATVVLLFQLVSDVSCQNPILNVKSFCAQDITGRTRVLVVSDMPDFSAVATCAGGFKYNFTSVDAPSKEIHMLYSGNASVECVLREKTQSSTYTAEVNVAVTSAGPLLDDQFYLITCTYDPFVQGQSNTNLFFDTMYPRHQAYQHMGANSTSVFKLTVVSVFYRTITGPIAALRYIRLKIELTAPSAGVVSFQVLNCAATDGTTSVDMVIAGCGDGKLIPSYRGFTTLGMFAYSDPFQTFRMIGGTQIYFTCTMVMCTSNCDGPSCAPRYKRAIVNGRGGVQGNGEVVAVISRLHIAASTGYAVVAPLTRRSTKVGRNGTSLPNAKSGPDYAPETELEVKVNQLKLHTENSDPESRVKETKTKKQNNFIPADNPMPPSDDANVTVIVFPTTVFIASVLAIVIAIIAIVWYTIRSRSNMKVHRSFTPTPYTIKF